MHFNLLMWNLNWTKLLEVVSVLCHSLNLVGKTRYHQRKITGKDAMPKSKHPSVFGGGLVSDWHKQEPHPHNTGCQLGFPGILKGRDMGSDNTARLNIAPLLVSMFCFWIFNLLLSVVRVGKTWGMVVPTGRHLSMRGASYFTHCWGPWAAHYFFLALVFPFAQQGGWNLHP